MRDRCTVLPPTRSIVAVVAAPNDGGEVPFAVIVTGHLKPDYDPAIRGHVMPDVAGHEYS